MVSDAHNIVFKFTYDGQCYYATFYRDGNATHIDNEILLYNTIPIKGKKYLKTLVLFNNEIESESFAIFKEEKGKLLSDMLINGEVTDELSENIANSLIEYFSIISTITTKNYGNLSNSYEGNYSTFLEYLRDYQIKTVDTLSKNDKTRTLSLYPRYLIDKYSRILDEGYSCVTPIDSNFNNIMITEKNEVKIIDPGAIVSAPINMGLGELTAHSYGTVIYEKLIKGLNASPQEVQRLSIYAILSLLNIIGDIEKSKPFGNQKTFFDLINEHLEIIEHQNVLLNSRK